MRRLRVVALTMLALAVPPFAFGGEEAPAGPAALSVSASLGGCGLAEATIVCGIDTSWNAIEGAEHYAVSVTRPDGSVLDLGRGANAGRTLFVPYVGSGSYSIQVIAWGTPPGEDDAKVLARDRATSPGPVAQSAGSRAPSRSAGRTPAAESRPAAAGSGPAAKQPDHGEQPVGEPNPCGDQDEADSEESLQEAAAVAAAIVAADPVADDPATDEYDPGDADGHGGCPLSASP